MKNPSNDQSRFAQVPKAEIPRSSFDRSHTHKTTFDVDELIPIFVDEVVPGDTFNLKMTAFGRLATPIFPIMDNVYLDSFFFFVPYRLVWDNFRKFMGEQISPGDSTDYLVPTLNQDSYTSGSIFDYMGLPVTLNDDNLNISALPFRAYNLIWNEWFRDQNLQDPVVVNRDDARDTTPFTLLKRGKRHDYFTSCLPWPQKGDAVSIPLGDTAPVLGIGYTQPNASSLGGTIYDGVPGTSRNPPFAITRENMYVETDAQTDAYPWIRADLSEATEVTINQLRQSFQIQKLLERDARGGTRYTEIIRAHFGVTSPDARLQRPEYLGGGSTPINISPIAQTQSTQPDSTPQGTLAAVGTVSINNNGFTQSFTEHGVIIGLVAARADLSYSQGVERWFQRRTRYDFYWPALAHIGEQSVQLSELYATNNKDKNTETFGYQERYAEMRYKPSKISGLFREDLDSWHLAQRFADFPLLNNTFIESTTPMDRVIAVTTEPHFIFDSYFKLTCARPMPVYGVPGLIDHF